MVHAEGYDQIKFMTDRLEREGKTHSDHHGGIAPRAGRARGDPPSDLACRAHRHPDHDRPCVGARGDGADRMGARAGLKIHAETCPQYLVLTAEDLKGLNMD